MTEMRNRRKKSNAGFSLVEVLLAICLLGLIAAPLLQMFYSSMALNQRSKKYLAAADLTQTIMEGVSCQTWEKSKPVQSGGTEVPGLDDYYNGAVKTGHKYLYSVPNGLANAPAGDIPSHTQSSDHIYIPFRNVVYGGYTFCVELDFDVSGVGGGKYYSVPIKVSVYDPGETGGSFDHNNAGSYKLLSTASTVVTSKR